MELYVHGLDSALALDPDVIRGVDHDFSYLGILKQLPYWGESEQVVYNQFGCLVLNNFTFFGKDRGATYICQRPILERNDAGYLIDKGVLDLPVVGAVSYDLRKGYSSDW